MINAEYREVDKRKIALSDAELSARLGRIVMHTDPELERVTQTVLQTAEPKYAVTRVKLSYPTDSSVDLGFATVESTALVKNLRGAREAFIFVVTLGASVDRMIARLSATSRAEAFIFDAVASALAEAACDVVDAEIRGSTVCRPRFSPGYADFDISHQPALLDFLGASTYLGVCVSESFLMTPMKTITAVMGICPDPV